MAMTGRLTALVVDDEQTLQYITIEMLFELGYDSVPAAHALAAMAALGVAAFDLVVTDVMMPGTMDGLGLAEVIRSVWPKTKVICVSGYPPDPIQLAAIGQRFLMKPYSYDQLAKMIVT
jgi:CheY-like chemotaxis protein